MRTIKDYMLEAQELDDQGKYAEAVELMDKVIERDDKFEGAYINRGAYKSSLGDYRGAMMITLKLFPLSLKILRHY